MKRLLLAARLCAFALILVPHVSQAEEPDWTYWVGPHFTGKSPVKNLPEKWNPDGGEDSHVLWKTEIGSRSTPVIFDGRLYMLAHSHTDDIKRAGERVVCLDAKSGQVLWDYEFNVYLSDVPIERVGWSSPVVDPETGNVYAQGVCGYFCCLNGKTGKLIWDRSLAEEFGFLNTYGGRTNYPLIHENNVLISAIVIGWGEQAKPNHRFLAMDKTNGQVVWYEGTRPLPEDTNYSAPVLGVIDGELQMVFGGGDGAIHGFQPRTGQKLWSYYPSGHGLNATPLIVGNKVYCGHSEENLDSTKMGGLVCIDATKRGDITESGTIWKTLEVAAGRSSPMMIDGRLYVTDDRAKLHCFNADTGKEIGKPVRLGTMMRANLLYADGKIYAHEVNSRGYVIKPTEEGAEIVHKFRFPRGEECYGSPIAWHGRMYVPTTAGMYCVGFADNKAEAGELPKQPQEPPVAADETPTQLELVPAESLLYPGTRQDFQVRLYNANGQYLRLAKAEEIEFGLKGPGEINKQGQYIIPESHQDHSAVAMTAKMNDITGAARIRVIPDLNWTFNFDDGKVPVTWVGAAYRHVPMDYELLSKLRKENQLLGDLYIYFMTEFTNYGPKRVFDDSTPQQRWKDMLLFLNLVGENRPGNVDAAKEKLSPSLQRLVDEKVLKQFTWSTWDRPTGVEGKTVAEPRLEIEQGERKIDGNGVLCKITTIPKGTRSQGWMGHPDLHDYTIQADVLGFSRQNKLPNIGLIAQRYTLDMMGASQQLQIRTWTPQLNRFSAESKFEWKPDVWYTMTFRAATRDGKAVLEGKAWPRGEKEPEDWSIMAEDIQPNLQGSPGLFGDATSGEVFYDNLTVTRNGEPTSNEKQPSDSKNKK